ncbi:MAG: hypothetical protein HP494_19610 [Nitrospira sp.]|nr:hypothetical protein [Nitrospira sp.]
MLRHCPPIVLLLTGFSWLVLASILGLAILIGLVHGTPLPPWVRQIHVHAALVGGVIQMILGGFLAMMPLSHPSGSTQQDSQLPAFLAINLSTVAMLIGFGFHHYQIVGAAGMLVGIACIWMAYVAWSRSSQNASSSRARWYYVVAFLALFGGLTCGEMLAFGLMPQSYGSMRLAHIHLGLLGFAIVVIIGTIVILLPTVLNTSASSLTLKQPALILMLLGIAVLIGGFLNASVPIELGAGGLIFAGSTLYTVNLFRTWMGSPHNGTAASDHLLIGVFFLLFTIVLGILVGINSLSSQPVMPFGTLHLIAYTHMALLGFMLQTSMGVLSHLIPLTLATSRVPNSKKRGPYLDGLSTIMDRWRTLQVGGLSLGTMGLGILASLTWNVPLGSIYIRVMTWTCFVLLLSSLLLFSVKLVMLLSLQPKESSSSVA